MSEYDGMKGYKRYRNLETDEWEWMDEKTLNKLMSLRKTLLSQMFTEASKRVGQIQITSTMADDNGNEKFYNIWNK